jgi:Fe2+ or Zn2+ uptake regulation protein
LKATDGRLKLLALLEKAKTPLSIKEIWQGLGRHVDLATIYRNLEILKSAGLVRQVEFQHDKAYFELIDNHDHHHIVCQNCGRIEDFVGCSFDDVVDQALRKSKWFRSISEHQFELFGLCNNCAKI